MFDAAAVTHMLRSRALAGSAPSELLRLLVEQCGARNTSELVLCFRTAFGLPGRELARIGGWSNDGAGTFSDDDIDGFLQPAMDETRSLWAEGEQGAVP